MSSPQQISNVLLEFDPLSTPASDPAPLDQLGGERGDTKAPEAVLSGHQVAADDEKVTTPPQASAPMADPVAPANQNKISATSSQDPMTAAGDLTTPTASLSDSKSVSPTKASSTEDTPTGGHVINATPTSGTKDTPTAGHVTGHVTGTKDMPTGGSKKKRKKKKHSSDKASKRDHATKTKATTMIGKGVGVKGHLSTQEISSEMSQIDQFLQSLRMGTYDPLNPQSASTATTTTTTTSSTVPPSAPPSANTSTTREGGVSTTREGGGATRSLGMQLIGQLGSSSSSDSWDSSSDSSDEDSEDEEDTSMVAIE